MVRLTSLVRRSSASRGQLDLGTSVAGRVLLVTARLDQLTERVVASNMPGLDKKTQAALFGGMGPLHSFSARIHIAKAMGIISAHDAAELHKLRKLRNEFAHSGIPLDWSDSKVRSLVAGLDGAQGQKPSRAYANAVSTLTTKLEAAIAS